MLPQKDRKEILNRLFSTAVNSLDSLVLVSVVTCSDGDLEELYKKYVNEGYEGAIIRKVILFMNLVLIIIIVAMF